MDRQNDENLNALVDVAARHLQDVLALSMGYSASDTAIIVSDDHSKLSRTIAAAYVRCLPNAKHLAFYDTAPDDLKAAFAPLTDHDLVILVQSGSFRPPDYRIRVELFKRGVKVIEHSNLGRMEDDELGIYIDALAYDPAYYQSVGYALKERIDTAQSAVVESGGESLSFDSPLEPAKLNIGDFTTLKNVGSQFPIGEVFTEAQDLERVSGRVRIYAFTDMSRRLNMPPVPITLVVAKGRVVDALDTTPDFEKVRESIIADEGCVSVRELGFGMNRAFSTERRVSDVGAFERVCGIHLSLGAKHGVYKKPHIRAREVRHHVDVFAVTEKVWLDETLVFDKGEWCVLSPGS